MKNIKILLIFLVVLLMIPSFKSHGFVSEDKGSITICIDPGHQLRGDKTGERMCPNSSEIKARVSQGTKGVVTKTPEYVVNLDAALILKDLLIKDGYNVVMTRESHDVNISNSERAQISNQNNAAMTVRIHCDSLSNSSKTGACILVPSSNSSTTKGIFDESNKYATILKENLKNSNIKVNGIFERSDITGFNWSQVPVVILEMGFMSNSSEDYMLNSKEYQCKIMTCVKDAINEYLGN